MVRGPVTNADTLRNRRAAQRRITRHCSCGLVLIGNAARASHEAAYPHHQSKGSRYAGTQDHQLRTGRTQRGAGAVSGRPHYRTTAFCPCGWRDHSNHPPSGGGLAAVTRLFRDHVHAATLENR